MAILARNRETGGGAKSMPLSIGASQTMLRGSISKLGQEKTLAACSGASGRVPVKFVANGPDATASYRPEFLM